MSLDRPIVLISHIARVRPGYITIRDEHFYVPVSGNAARPTQGESCRPVFSTMSGTIPFQIVITACSIASQKETSETAQGCLAGMSNPPTQLATSLKDFVASEVVVPSIPRKGRLCHQTQMRPKIFFQFEVRREKDIVEKIGLQCKSRAQAVATLRTILSMSHQGEDPSDQHQSPLQTTTYLHQLLNLLGYLNNCCKVTTFWENRQI